MIPFLAHASTVGSELTLPQLRDPKLGVELVAEGLQLPTSMTFVDETKLLVTQKGGTVIYVSFENATAQSSQTPLVKFNVSISSERGLLGVALMNNSNAVKMTAPQANEKLAFFYLTETENNEPSANNVYRYKFDATSGSLSNRTLILSLPAAPGPNHNGGKMIPDGQGHVYVVIGDLNRNGILQNHANASEIDNTSVILRINPDGSAAASNPFLNYSSSDGNYQNLSRYYAYGIRNSFGMSIDPGTGTLWITENGPAGYDEINIVKPGFNSGWEKAIGPIERRNVTEGDMVRFPNSTYADPVFNWRETVGVTDIEFLTSSLLGSEYMNNIFVGDFNNGALYYFEVNDNRSGLKFTHPGLYDDLVASNEGQVKAVLFGVGFGGGITDIETGPDGHLYVLTYAGAIYRIAPH
jgi:glucose/arabinose dehydrogenase